MMATGSRDRLPVIPPSSNVRPAVPVLDEVDRRLVALLAADARLPNNALADAVGIAPSTCLGRIRALREKGVIRGYHADIDQVALGQGLQALIAVRLQSGARDQIGTFIDRIRSRPEVQSVFFLAGANDFLIHIAAADSAQLRMFVVDELSAHPAVAFTETNLVFEHQRGDSATTH